MNNKKSIGILLEFGFHEIKKYINSGFIEVISREFNIVWIALDKGSGDFDRYFRNTGFPLVYVNEDDIQCKSSRIEDYNRIIRRNWVTNKGMGAFHNHTKIVEKSLRTRFLGSTLLKNLMENVTLSSISKSYQNETLRKVFVQYQIDSLFITGTSSSFAKCAVLTANSINLSVHYLINSWKDLYINNFVPFRNLSTIFVWSEKMKSDYLNHMPYLKDIKFVVSGNPTFDSLLNSKPKEDKHFYEQKYNIPYGSSWLLYTMMPVGLAMDELDTIIYTANELLKYFSKEVYTIIVRKNPTHTIDDFKGIALPENMVIADHYCSFDKKSDMIIQTPEGEQEWLDLLHHSLVNLSVPSTVTLEFLTLGKSVFNISYNSKGQLDERILQFFNAGFYNPLFNRNDVINIQNIEQLIKNLKNLNKEDVSGNRRELSASNIIVQHLAKI